MGRRSNWSRDVVALAVLSGMVLSARATLADHYKVPSGSMEPTVEVGDRVAVNKAAYGLRLPGTDRYVTGPAMPRRGDVIVLTSPEDGKVLLKRVVAVAGDRVAVRRGRLVLNGKQVPLVHTAGGVVERLDGAAHALSLTHGGGPGMAPTRVPAGQLLVMGDSRGNSHDGRSFGFVPVTSVLGKATAVYMRDRVFDWIEL